MSDMTPEDRAKGMTDILEAHAGLLRAESLQPKLANDGHLQEDSPEWQKWFIDVYAPASDRWTEVANRAGAMGYPSISLNPTLVVAWCHRELPAAA